MRSLSTLTGIGPKTETYLNNLKISTPKDLLFHFPYRYLDFTHITKIKNLIPDTLVTIKGTLISFQNIFTRRGLNLQKAKLIDDTGTIDLLWFNQPYLSKTLKIGFPVGIAGQVGLFQNRPTLISPRISASATGKILPIYPTTAHLSSANLSKIIISNLSYLLSNIVDLLLQKVLKDFSLMSLKAALKEIHQPSSIKLLNIAQKRLKINEFLSILAFSHHQKTETQTLSCAFTLKNIAKINTFIKNLPFSLTSSQLLAWKELKNDLLLSIPCHRLLSGDVGSGKTIIALLGCYLNHLNGYQSLYLAPTEILAHQHVLTFKKFLPKIPIFLLTSKNRLKNIPQNAIIISTHAALYQPQNFFNRLAFVVIDEQHKFGVDQRNTFNQNNLFPHTLTMTATPIPRTLSLTLLGHLDLSRLETLPDRKPVSTFYVPTNKISACYQWLTKHIDETRQQVFFVCPFIDDSETLTEVKSVKTEFDNLKTVFPQFKLELLHSQIPTSQKDKIITDFINKKINILVTTPVIEVGIDIPNATVMVIESADRFGLASLHQLRGRVGRSDKKSYCFLLCQQPSLVAQNRLSFLEKHHDGLKIAEYDLKNRGPGVLYSTLQHGFPSLSLATIDDIDTLSLSRKIFEKLKDIPSFNSQKFITHQAENKITVN